MLKKELSQLDVQRASFNLRLVNTLNKLQVDVFIGDSTSTCPGWRRIVLKKGILERYLPNCNRYHLIVIQHSTYPLSTRSAKGKYTSGVCILQCFTRRTVSCCCWFILSRMDLKKHRRLALIFGPACLVEIAAAGKTRSAA